MLLLLHVHPDLLHFDKGWCAVVRILWRYYEYSALMPMCRFDLIYLVLDKAEEATDRKLARHLLSLHYERGQNAAQVGYTYCARCCLKACAVNIKKKTPGSLLRRLVAENRRRGDTVHSTCFSCLLWLQAPISIDKLRDFIAYARSNCHPELCAEAATDIVDGYMHMRRMGSSRKVCLDKMQANLGGCKDRVLAQNST